MFLKNNNVQKPNYPIVPGSSQNTDQQHLQSQASPGHAANTSSSNTEEMYHADRNRGVQFRAQANSLNGRTFKAIDLLCETDDATIHKVKDVNTNHNQYLAAKIGDENSLNHQINIYNRMGRHPNLNHIHGSGVVNVDGTHSKGMIMDINDFDGDEALSMIRNAREDGSLSEHDLLDKILPYVGRALVGIGLHSANVRVSLNDIDSSNLTFSKDGERLEAIDLELASIEDNEAQNFWPEDEIQSGNPMVKVYPTDCEKIGMTLRMFAGLINEYGENEEPENLTEPMIMLKNFLLRLDPANSCQKDSAHFEFLSRGDDQAAKNLLRTIFQNPE